MTFATKQGREITLPGKEFLRRFVQHVLPKGFTRIRHDGLLAASHATTTLERARALLTPTPAVAPAPSSAASVAPPALSTWQERAEQVSGRDPSCCERCKTGHIVRVPLAQGEPPAGCDTS